MFASRRQRKQKERELVAAEDRITVYQNVFKDVLSPEQIRKIVTIVKEEVAHSAGFGLQIRPEDVVVETTSAIMLFRIRSLGDYRGMVEAVLNTGYEICHGFLRKLLYDMTIEQTEYYWEVEKNDSTKNKYQCHISAIIDQIMREIVKG